MQHKERVYGYHILTATCGFQIIAFDS